MGLQERHQILQERSGRREQKRILHQLVGSFAVDLQGFQWRIGGLEPGERVSCGDGGIGEGQLGTRVVGLNVHVQ